MSNPPPPDAQAPDPQASSPPDPQPSIDAVVDATARLEAAVDTAIETGGAQTCRAASLLPDWSLGHVITHLARNADGLRRVLLAARDGRQVTLYDSPQAREDDIRAGAGRATEVIADDLRTANQRLAELIGSLPRHVWLSTVDLGRGGPTTADVILSARLGEVELHHHDLGVDDGLGLLDDAQANRLLAALLRSYVRTRGVHGITLLPDGAAAIAIGGGGQQIGGPAIDLVGWLAGRSAGAGLRTAGPLPDLPTW